MYHLDPRRRVVSTLRAFLALGILLGASALARAATTRNVPSQYGTIQAAINASTAGDTIVVAAGTYHESLQWTPGKNLTIQGAGASQSIIDPSGPSGPGDRCLRTSNLTSASKIEGFTFRSGVAFDGYGGGMYNGNSSPQVTNCAFTGNTATNYDNPETVSGGGGMYNVQSSPTLTNCTFTGNTAVRGGGMLNDAYSSPTLTNCILWGNTANAFGGGMFNDAYSSPTLTNCILWGNYANAYGGGMLNVDSSPTLTNCILWGNYAVFAGRGIMGGGLSSPSISHTDSQDFDATPDATPDGNGNFGADPLFVDAAGGDLRLSAGSPCIDAGVDAAVTSPPFPAVRGVLIDLAGNARIAGKHVDQGAYEFGSAPPPLNWSGFLSPLNKQSFNRGSTIPVKFALTGTSAGITNLVARLYVRAPGAGSETLLGTFTYDPRARQYQYNWNTSKGMVAGTYVLRADLGDGVTRTVNVVLK